MKKILSVAFFGLALALVGCGDDTGDDDTACSSTNASGTCAAGQHCDAGSCVADEILITISGVFVPHPVSDGMNVGAYAQSGGSVPRLSFGVAGDMIIQIVDPVDIIGNPTGFTPLAQGPLDVATCTDIASPTGLPAVVDSLDCTFSFADVDISNLTLGLVALLIDTRSTPEFITTTAGVFGSGTVSTLQASGADFDTAKLLIVSDSSLAGLVMVLNGASTMAKTKQEVIDDGFLFGLMLTDALAPAPGVVVSAAASEIELFYFADNFVSPAAATNAGGFFLGVATPADGVNTVNSSWSVTDVGSSGATWADLPAAGTSRGTAFSLAWIAD